MWIQMKRLWQSIASRSSAVQANQQRSRISVSGQKWFAGGESLRVVEIEANGAVHLLALLSSKSGSQMLNLGTPALPLQALRTDIATRSPRDIH